MITKGMNVQTGGLHKETDPKRYKPQQQMTINRNIATKKYQTIREELIILVLVTIDKYNRQID